MKQSWIACSVTSVAVVAIVFFASGRPAPAQTLPNGGAGASKAAPGGPVPRMSDGHPDLSGVWWPGQDVGVKNLAIAPAPRPGGAQAPPRPPSFQSLYQPWAAAKAKTLSDKDDPALRCIPSVIGPQVSLYDNGLVGQIIQTPKFVVLLTETYHAFRLVPTDGRPHRDDVAPSYRGDSVGHWEGDTLVVDATNFTDTNWVADHGNVSFHSDALHLVERYRRIDANTLEVEATVEDPKVLTQPWTAPKRTLKLAPFDQIMEVMCTNVETASLMDAASKENYGRK